MGFWSFVRRMIVLDWLFGGRNNGSNRSHSHSGREWNDYTDYSHDDGCGYGGYMDYRDDYARQDFDDDLDCGMFDDDF